eukprot:3585042-Rhodomonas_salina.2
MDIGPCQSGITPGTPMSENRYGYPLVEVISTLEPVDARALVSTHAQTPYTATASAYACSTLCPVPT